MQLEACERLPRQRHTYLGVLVDESVAHRVRAVADRPLAAAREPVRPASRSRNVAPSITGV